jgi:methionine synthase I (cobalamin-dependent)
MFSEDELGAAIQAADAAELPWVATMTFDMGGHTMMGLKPEQAARNIKKHGSKPVAFGTNCGMGPAQLIDTVIGLLRGAEPGDAIVSKGNAGLPKMGKDMRVEYDGTPQVMADYACLARDAGARIIGGCCGTTAEHLRVMVEAVMTRPRQEFPSYERIERELGPVKIVGADKPRPQRKRKESAD